MKLRIWHLVTIVMLAAILIRIWNLIALPLPLYWDEVAILIDARLVAFTGHDLHQLPWWHTIFPSYGDFKLPVYIWVTAGLVKLFGESEMFVRVPSLLAGIGSVAMVAVIARQLTFLSTATTSKKKASFTKVWPVLAAAVVAFSPWSLHFSRVGFESHLAQLLLVSSVSLLLQFFISHKWTEKLLVLLLATGLATLSVYTYYAASILWPLLLVVTTSLVGVNKKLTNTHTFSRSYQAKAVVIAVLSLTVFGVLLQPLLRNVHFNDMNAIRLSTDSILSPGEYAVQSNLYRELAGNQVWDRIFFHRHILLVRQLVSNYSDFFSLDYLFLSGDPNLRHGTGAHGLFYLVWLPFLLIGLGSNPKSDWRQLLFLTSWWLIALLPAAVPEETPHALRSLNALLPLALILSRGMSIFYHFLKEQATFHISVDKNLVVIATNLMFICLFMIPTLHWQLYVSAVYPYTSAIAWQAGYSELAAVVLEDTETPTYIFNFDDRFYLWLLNAEPRLADVVQSSGTRNYRIDQLEEITFSLPNGKSDQSDLIRIVGTTQTVNDYINAHQVEVIDTKVLTDSSGKASFSVGMIKLKD